MIHDKAVTTQALGEKPQSHVSLTKEEAARLKRAGEDPYNHKWAAYRPCIELYRQRPTAIRVSITYCACIGRIVRVSDFYRHSSCESTWNTCIAIVSRRICGVSEDRVLALWNTMMIHFNTCDTW